MLARLLPAQSVISITSTPAPPVATGIQTDLSIAGPGYFILRDPESFTLHVTRYGNFTVDSCGYLVSAEGMRVQGNSDSTLTNHGDIQINSTTSPDGDTAPVQNFTIGSSGVIWVTLADGCQFVRGQILLQNFGQPEALKKSGMFTYGPAPAADPLPPQPPGTGRLGSLQSGSLEPPVTTVELTKVHGPAPLFAHGLLHATGVPTDLGIEGDGYFILRDPLSQALFVTRVGAFLFDPDGYLVNYSGLRVQGYDATALKFGDVRVPMDPPIQWSNISRNGDITVAWPDGTVAYGGVIMLCNSLQPTQLVRTNFSLFRVNTNCAPETLATACNRNGAGWIAPGNIEVKAFDASLLSVRRNLNFFGLGPLVSTGAATDLAINGNGFLIVRNPADNSFYATRCGHFTLDATGRLVTTNGWRVQGFSNPGLAVSGDLVIDAAQGPVWEDGSVPLLAFAFNSDGKITVLLADGTQYTRAQVTLQQFRNPQALQSADGTCFTNLAAALPMFDHAVPGSCGLGWLATSALEIIPSYHLPELDPLPSSGFRVLANDLQCGTTTIETSDDLVHWTVLGPVSANDIGAAEFFDTNAPAATGRFYRTRSEFP